MRKLLLLLPLLLLAPDAFAQLSQTAEVRGATSTTFPRGASTSPYVASPHAENVMFSYYNSELAIRPWPAPVEFTPLLVIMYGQRVTLPNDYGFVDSVRILLGQTQGDSIVVSLMHDTLFEVSSGQFAHIIDIFEEGTDYARVAVPLSDTLPGGWLTVRFPKVFVRKDFFVVVEPYINDAGQATSAFELIGDVRQPEPLTTDGARSAFVSITPQNFYLSALLDGVVQFDGEDQTAFTNFYIEAYVDVTSQSVSSGSEREIAIYPNPVSRNATLRLDHSAPIVRVELQNVLGHRVLSMEVHDTTFEIPTRGLAPGLYHALIETDEGVVTQKIIIQ